MLNNSSPSDKMASSDKPSSLQAGFANDAEQQQVEYIDKETKGLPRSPAARAGRIFLCMEGAGLPTKLRRNAFDIRSKNHYRSAIEAHLLHNEDAVFAYLFQSFLLVPVSAGMQNAVENLALEIGESQGCLTKKQRRVSLHQSIFSQSPGLRPVCGNVRW